MSLFPWDDSYNINIEIIDKQHQVLVELIDELLISTRSQESNLDINEILHALENYTKDHFTYEENLLKENNYEDFDLHKQSHDDFVLKIKEFKEKVKNDEEAYIVSELGLYLMEWLKDHIKVDDKKFAEKLNAIGVY